METCADEPEFQKLCKEYLCLWRQDKWLNKRPDYRPDRLVVIFQLGEDGLVIFENSPGSLDSQQVAYIKRRLMKHLLHSDALVENFPVGVLDAVHIAPSDVRHGQSELNPETHKWVYEGGNEFTLHRSSVASFFEEGSESKMNFVKTQLSRYSAQRVRPRVVGLKDNY